MDTNKQSLLKIFSVLLKKKASEKVPMETKTISPVLIKYFTRKELVEMVSLTYGQELPEGKNLLELENSEILNLIESDYQIILYMCEKWLKEEKEIKNNPPTDLDATHSSADVGIGDETKSADDVSLLAPDDNEQKDNQELDAIVHTEVSAETPNLETPNEETEILENAPEINSSQEIPELPSENENHEFSEESPLNHRDSQEEMAHQEEAPSSDAFKPKNKNKKNR